MSNLPATGLELRLMRVAADVRVGDLATAMGISSGSLSRIEGSRRVTEKAARRYVTALATFATSQTAPDGQSAA